MKFLTWLLRAVLFLLLFIFALRNDALVTLHVLAGLEWTLPLSLLLLLFFAVGAVLGLTAAWSTQLRLRRELARLRQPAASVPADPVPTAPSRRIPDDVIDAV